MKELLSRLFNQEVLTRDQAKQVLGEISESKYHPYQICSFLTVFKMRSITLDELLGFRDCLLERCVAVDLSDLDLVDLCGTGGDGKDTFNVSTLASFLVAGAGYQVAKHGNYSVSSTCGSSDVMEYLGYQFSSDHEKIKKEIEQYGISFLHAPLFHPAMKEVAPVRKNIGVRTFFNMLGPMVNPSRPGKQLVGVFSMQLLRYYKYIYEQEEFNYRIIHALDGYDEISLTGPTKVVGPDQEYLLDPKEVIGNCLDQEQLYGGKNVEEAAKIFTNVLEGSGSRAQNEVVIANAAMAIQCFNPAVSYADCFLEAKEALESGKAYLSFKNLVS